MDKAGGFYFQNESSKFANEMILLFSHKRVVTRVSPKVVVQPVPQYILAPSPVSSERNRPNNIEKIPSQIRPVTQNTRIHPQDSDSNGPQPPAKKFLTPRENMRNANKVTDNEGEE
ncbi:hypothetical protein O181_010802 [Austropuccinia psidii MF-1]|uniref:Uncharacterized protein n=1 Tax=Austropuccinia psidii MF-1 TaxID=1389203 RepID=A0A9Q3GLJ9_9BASI|nr:hypothetical protein [Austropuccinia psidii MF-1]